MVQVCRRKKVRQTFPLLATGNSDARTLIRSAVLRTVEKLSYGGIPDAVRVVSDLSHSGGETPSILSISELEGVLRM